MRKRLTIIALSVIISFEFVGCSESSKNNTEQIRCFKNELSFKNDASQKDILELKLSIEGEKVTGDYNWFPVQKDQRKGHLNGTIQNNVINATYIFSQEGIKDTSQLTITLNDAKAIVKGGKAQLGLDATIIEVDCTKF